MMGRAIVPIANLNRRLPEAGRLRMGVKVDGTSRAGKAYQRPTSIETWRFTSHDEQALEQVAAIYGGTVKPWVEPKADPGQFELVSEASELRIVLPPDPLGGTPIYEHWTGGGCDRRCDGLQCTILVKGPEGVEPVDVPCKCTAEGSMMCDPRTRLSVILPEVRFGGVWRLDTGGWDAAQELPGMVDLLQEMQGKGLTTGLLRLEHRRKVVMGETRNFPVPVLALMESMDALVTGAARFGAIGSGATVPRPELAAGSSGGEGTPLSESPTGPGAPVGTLPASPPDVADDDIEDAVIVEPPTPAPTNGGPVCGACGLSLAGCAVKIEGGVRMHKDGCPTGSGPDGPGAAHESEPVHEPNATTGLEREPIDVEAEQVPAASTQSDDTVYRDVDIHQLAAETFARAKDEAPRGQKSKIVDRCRHVLTHAITNGHATSLKDLTAAEKHRLWMELTWIKDGHRTYEVTADALIVTHNGRETVLPFADIESEAA